MRNLLLSVITLIVLAGCAGTFNYNSLETHMKADRCSLAADYIKMHEKDYGDNQKLLFLLDSAIINMLCGNYEESNRYFHSAEDLAGDLWTKSLTKETASFLVNDYTIPYGGEDFEKALINLFSAINYVKLGLYDEAIVECKRLDAYLSAVNDKYEEKNVYKEDAFARYISGMIYEAQNNLDDAYIDYYRALQVFKDYEKNYDTPVPRILLEDLYRTAGAVGRTEEVKSFFNGIKNAAWMKQEEIKGLGRIIFIQLNGKSPVKKEDKLFIPTKEGPVTIAFPGYVVNQPSCRQSRIIIESRSLRREAGAELVEDVNKIAVKNLEDRKVRIIAKTIARVAAKQASIHKITKDENVRRLLNIANTLVERADTRTWRTLPGEIYLSRLFVPEGEYFLYVDQCWKVQKLEDYVNVKAGETKFILFESMY